VTVVPTTHLDDLRLMTPVKGAKFSFPAERFGMATIAALALRQDGPYRMQLAVFAEKVRPAQPARSDVPDTHQAIISYIPHLADQLLLNFRFCRTPR
jgi:hypothetical protein